VSYLIKSCEPHEGMDVLKQYFLESQPDFENLVLFSTSGIHGYYTTIEDYERTLLTKDYEIDPDLDMITFVMLQPRAVVVHYGNCQPTSLEEIAWLKELRRLSHIELAKIGLDVGSEAE